MANLGCVLATVVAFVFCCAHPSVAVAASRLDMFHEALEQLNVTGDRLPLKKGEEYYEEVLHRVSCNETGIALSGVNTQLQSCSKNLCLDINAILQVVGGNVSAGLSEDEFEKAAMMALYILSRGRHPCNSTVGPEMPAEAEFLNVRQIFAAELQQKATGLTTEDDLEDFLENMKNVYESEEHEHEEEGEHEEEEDHHDDKRKKRSADDVHTDHADDDDHDNDTIPSVVKAKCLAPDAVLYYLGVEEEGRVKGDDFVSMTTVIVHLMFEGSPIEDECRQLPKQSYFVTRLIYHLMQGGGNLTRAGLEMLMDKLEITSHASEVEDDGHGHMRRRRSLDSGDVSASRVRRQVLTTDTKCYSPAELSAVFETGDVITPEKLTQLSPALVYQKLYGQCAVAETAAQTDGPTIAERWGYSFLAVFIICLCAIVGVLIAPCMNHYAYKVTIALFIGLAVGTLTGDTMLHLIPLTMEAHAEEEDDGHGHTTEQIVVEEYVWFSLVTLAGIYVFYLIESIFSRWAHGKNASHGHSHSMELVVDGDGKKAVTENSAGPNRQAEGQVNVSLSMMIIVGDAVHNFADGLAIGAAFSSSVNAGIATAIAVFCHELPHELGDFAVLLQNGMSVKRAMFWNFFSAITAFLGLIVSLLVATDDDVRKWIFAVTAGMFLYIALTDLLPSLTSRESSSNTVVFIMNNIGMLLGVAIMLATAIFEERIKIA